MSRLVSFAISKKESPLTAKLAAKLNKKGKFFSANLLGDKTQAYTPSESVCCGRPSKKPVQMISKRRLLGQFLALRFQLALHDA